MATDEPTEREAIHAIVASLEYVVRIVCDIDIDGRPSERDLIVLRDRVNEISYKVRKWRRTDE